MADVLTVWDACWAQQWKLVVQECAVSGLSNREFCRQLEPKSFRWRMEGPRIEQKTAIRIGKLRDLF